jgi:REP element-mobilizing transposase RayT
MPAFCQNGEALFAGRGPNRDFYLPRLPREYYQADAVVHWSLAISKRRSGWLSDDFHLAFRELMLHCAAREGLLCPTYCLMPDHLHLIWMGLRRDTDQLNGMSFLRTHLEPKLSPHRFQHQAHDHVLKPQERRRQAFARVCHYVLANPIQAELVKNAIEWRFCGTILPGYPATHPLEDDFWQKFWRIYAQSKHADAANINRPAIS